MKVQVFVPAQGGSGLGTPAEGVTVFPQSSTTVGGVGAVAPEGQATVEDVPRFARYINEHLVGLHSTFYVFCQTQ